MHNENSGGIRRVALDGLRIQESHLGAAIFSSLPQGDYAIQAKEFRAGRESYGFAKLARTASQAAQRRAKQRYYLMLSSSLLP